MKWNLKIVAFVFLLVLVGASLQAQRYNFKTYNVNEGLAQAQVTTICQDDQGYLWIGTLAGGITKFDGINFINYTIKDGLSSNSINNIFKDRNGDIWIGTRDGLNKYIPAGKETGYNKERFVLIDDDPLIAVSGIETMREDAEGNFWIASHRSGVLRYNPETHDVLKLSVNDGLASDHMHDLIIGKDSSVWIGTGKGLNKYDPYAQRAEGENFSLYTKEDGLFGNHITQLFEDHNGFIWVASSSGGVDRFDGQTFKHFAIKGAGRIRLRCMFEDSDHNMIFGTDQGVCKIAYDELEKENVVLIPNLTSNEGLSNNKVNQIYQDTEGNIWFATDGGGIIKYQGKRFVNITTKDGLSHNNVTALYMTKNNDIWMGTLGEGLNVFNGETFSLFTKESGLRGNDVWSILEDDKDNVWVGTSDGVSIFKNGKLQNSGMPKEIAKLSVDDMIQDKNGNIWFCSDGKGVIKYDGSNYQIFSVEQGLGHEDTWCVLEDRDGNIWVGNEAGLSKIVFDESNSNGYQIYHYVVDGDLIDPSAMDLQEDYQGNIWIGSNEGGLYRITPTNDHQLNTKKIKHIDASDGLSSDVIYGIELDNDQNLWVGTIRGLDKLDLKKYYQIGKVDIRHYGIEEGVIGLECNHNAAFKDSKGNLWFGTTGGVVKYNPEEDILNLKETYTNITHHRLFFNDTLLSDGVILPYDQNHLSFEFIGICLSNPKNVRYQYKLSGFDKNWSPITVQNVATYSNIGAGAYTFLVRTCNNDGVWNKTPTSFSFSILPPFWKTWWFYSLSLMLTLGGIFVFFKLRMQKLEEESNRKTEMISAMVHAQETERKRIAVDLHDGVGNLLSSIKMNLSALETEKEKLQNDKQKVYENAVALIDDACKDLRAISHNMMPGSLVELGLIHALEEQFDKVSAAGEFKINFKITGFKDRLAETVEVVLYRVIQEIFNNILKHADATKVNVLMVKKKSEIKIDVIDNGNGFDMSKNKTKNGIGLSNIESRVGYLNGTVEFESRKNEGTRVLVQIPIKEN